MPGVPDGLLSRVRKLLAQAEDSAVTAAEAEAFNAKAAELVARYGIDAALLADAGRVREDVGRRVVVVESPYARDRAHLLTCVAEALRCRTVHTYGPGLYRVAVYGFSSDLERVELMYTSLLLQATRGLAHVTVGSWGRPAASTVAAYRRSWLSGFACAVHGRLVRAEQRAVDEQPMSGSGASTVLVLADRTDQVDRAVKAAHPRLRTMGRRRLSGDGEGEGYGAGSRADLGQTAVGGPRALSR